MELHDKDMDQLFRAGLHGLEAQPSDAVWGKIATQIGQPARSRGLMPYLRVAASILVLLGTSTWLLVKQPHNSRKTGKRTQTAMQISRPKIIQLPLDNDRDIVNKEQHPGTIAATGWVAGRHSLHRVGQHKADESLTKPEAAQSQESAVRVPADAMLAQTLVPDNITAVAPVEEKPVFKSIAALPVAHTLAADASAIKTKTKKHGIHSLGDVVNLVVAKVDKREDKLIEFTDNEEGEAEVTGINLGLFRIKKDQQ